MKPIIAFVLFCLASFTAFAQKMPDEGLYKVRITLPDLTILAEINPVSSSPEPKPGLLYYWYEANAIHSTEGGFSGKLLNGVYTEYYANKNLKEQGDFKKGLKNGPWKSWNPDGALTEVVTWKNGMRVSGEKVPLWRRLPLLRKKNPETQADTSKKPG